MKHLHLMPEKDYLIQTTPYNEQINQTVSLINDAEIILIGGGAGLSTAAGLNFSGKRFTDNFKDFIDKYGDKYMTDFYSAGFYPFKTEEEYWAYWSRHAYMNRVITEGLPVYKQLYNLVNNKEHFVITTNADALFVKSGFEKQNVFATQGDFGFIQCTYACHSKTYDAMDMFTEMKDKIFDCKIPSDLVPICPKCGGRMEMSLRNNQYFVEDDAWHKAEENYSNFLKNIESKKIVLLELGLGFNTPMIIRYPFEKMTKENSNAYLIRLNLDDVKVPKVLGNRVIGIKEDIAKSINDIYKLYKK